MKETLIRWAAALLTPLVLIFLTLRLMLSPVFIQVEYRLPWFPPDPYGFTRADRLHWAGYALEYLTNEADISYLGQLQFADGRPLFNARELRHMEDVKNVVTGGLLVGRWALFTLTLLALFAWRSQRVQWLRQGLQRGGWLTIWLVVFSALFGLISFSQFFVFFHRLFFEGNTWLFYYSDTLIRLFPIRFWQDAFLLSGLMLITTGLLLACGLQPRKASCVHSGV